MNRPASDGTWGRFSSRRKWLAQAGLGFGGLALLGLLERDARAANPLAPKLPHFMPRARSVIFLFMHGGPSQVDTFDPKPALAKYDGQPPPKAVHDLQLQFTKVAQQKLMASRQTFRRCGRSGIAISDSLPRLQACADDLAVLRGCHHNVFNHTPGIYLMNTGHDRMGRPSLGSWVTYGLGSPADNLPGFVVMNDGPLKPGAGVWGNGFLPAAYQGTLLSGGDNERGQAKMMGQIDRGTAALLKDLKARGLLGETLVIWGGEFGRTPTTEGKSGRDHSPYGFSMWLAGGGVKGGQVIGATDELGFKAVEDRLHVHDLHATILKLLGLEHTELTYPFQGRQQRLTDVAGHHDIADRLTRS